jgi:hypothetical protein
MVIVKHTREKEVDIEAIEAIITITITIIMEEGIIEILIGINLSLKINKFFQMNTGIKYMIEHNIFILIRTIRFINLTLGMKEIIIRCIFTLPHHLLLSLTVKFISNNIHAI